MKKYFEAYKPFLAFLVKFILSYAILGLLYKYYLSFYNSIPFEVDFITQEVATQTQKLISFLGYQAEQFPHLKQKSIKLFVNGVYVARVVEGCNAISVILLFCSFIIAFKGKLKSTLLFIVMGSLLIYILNVVRIALVAIALLHYPNYEHFIHGVVFPLIIYGIVFLLWVVWVTKFSVHGKKS